MPSNPTPAVKRPSALNTAVNLTMGMLSFRDAGGNTQSCTFQFNPTELERSRTVKFTRTPTGNTLEEPNAGPRNQAKRKATRKPDPWDMTLSLRYDAGYYPNAEPPPSRPFKQEVERIATAMRFFEALAEPAPLVSENESNANANETPPPPQVTLQYGRRSWQCVVKTVRIKEQDYTYDLYPRRFEVTLSLEVIETVAQNEQGKVGGVR